MDFDFVGHIWGSFLSGWMKTLKKLRLSKSSGYWCYLLKSMENVEMSMGYENRSSRIQVPPSAPSIE